ncbi:zinc finger protein 512B [Rhinophrynus dorsalis]
MTDSAVPRRSYPRRGTKNRASSQAHTLSNVMNPASEPVKLGDSANKESDQKKYQKQENRALRRIPAALSSRLPFSCSSCEAIFTSKSQLQKHLVWNHPLRGSSREKRPPHPAGSSLGRNRPSESSPRPHRHSKVGSSQENGEIPLYSRGIKQKDVCLSDEDPERMRHRRKQKTPKKFTGEQPSITGTFGLKGLGKSEEKSRGRHTRIVRGRTEEGRKREEGVSLRREITAPPPGSVDDRGQRQISKRGEVICPNCCSVTRKTMAGLRKHMEVCEQLQEALRCQHCRKQFKSKAGLNYHTMAEHVNKSSTPEDVPVDEQKERERLRKVLKQMGKLRCPSQDCSASFSSLMGYHYHTQRCGKEPCEWERLRFTCPHCNKEYQSKAGRDYHVRSEHCPVPVEPEPAEQEAELEDFERTPSGRVRRRSAQVAVFHLQEIAEDELAKEGGRRRIREDLVPDSKRLNYLRPGLPTFNPQLLDSWKNRVKENGFICCPNNCCEAIYSSVSGLKAHLANCNKGNHSVGKYRCLLCQKEFSSESGVKYHILKTHSQNWFRLSSVSSPHKRKAPDVSGDEVGAVRSKQKKPKGRLPVASLDQAIPRALESPPVLKTAANKQTSKVGGHAKSSDPRGTVRKGGPPQRGK